MRLYTWEDKDHDTRLAALKADGRADDDAERLLPRWRAGVEGPWYDDSDPVGTGETEAEARADALATLKWKYDLIGAFLKEQGIL